jgi:hypothetical protein
MSKDLRTLTLGERLRLFPPFLCFALTRVKLPPHSLEEKRGKYWNRENRELRRKLRENGIPIERRKTHRRMTVDEVKEKFPQHVRWYVPQLVRRVNWDEVQIRDALHFMAVCGIDIVHAREVRIRLRGWAGTNTALNHLDDRQKREFAKLVIEWKKICNPA